MSLFDLTGKVAVVTGGNGGIGLGIALGLAGAGARIAVVGRDAGKSEAAARRIADEAGAESVAIPADVADEADCARVVAEATGRLGRLDILVNNAGVIVRKPPQDMTLAEWESVVSVNLNGVFLLSKAAYPALKASGAGAIVNIGSMTSIFGSPYAASYAATKGAVVQLTKSLALAWARDGIRVNAILPGWIDTEMTAGARAQVPGLNERVVGRVPSGRWGVPADLAGTAIWLASDASAYVTGVAVPVDGGFSSAL
jgi:2-deoxy-D-gluconate 3-dehydrogenase